MSPRKPEPILPKQTFHAISRDNNVNVGGHGKNISEPGPWERFFTSRYSNISMIWFLCHGDEIKEYMK